MATQEHKSKPVTTLRCSSIKASIWKNEGTKGPFYNVTVARSRWASRQKASALKRSISTSAAP